MAHAPLSGRWMPVPAKQVFDLAAKTSPHTVLVWLSMLNDATQNDTWLTTRNIESIMSETGLTKPTVIKAQADLVEAGLIEKVSGGGQTRRKITFAVTPIASFRGEPAISDKKGSKPVGAWTL